MKALFLALLLGASGAKTLRAAEDESDGRAAAPSPLEPKGTGKFAAQLRRAGRALAGKSSPRGDKFTWELLLHRAGARKETFSYHVPTCDGR